MVRCRKVVYAKREKQYLAQKRLGHMSFSPFTAFCSFASTVMLPPARY